MTACLFGNDKISEAAIALQINEASRNSLETLLAAASHQQAQGGTSLELIVILLQLGRPHHFDRFEAFGKWRGSMAATLSQSLVLGAAGPSILPLPMLLLAAQIKLH